MTSIFPVVNGQTIVLPGVYGSVVGNSTYSPNAGGNDPLIFVAQSYGVQPQTPVLFTDPNSLISAMRGSPSAQFVPFFFNPSSQLNGASQIYLINVSPSTQSTATIFGTASAGNITLTSTNYGSPSNLLYYTLTEGNSGGYTLSITDKYSGATVTGNNLGIPFALGYQGTATSGVTYQVELPTGAQYPSFILTSPNPGESVTFTLSPDTFPTVTSLINAINGIGPYVAYGVSSSAGQTPANLLDITSGQVTIPTGGTSFVYVTAYIADLTTWVNDFSGLATATPTTPYPYYQPYSLTLETNVAFTGASNGVPTSSDYAQALQTALNYSASVIFIDSNEPSIVALGVQHVQTAATTGVSLPRRYVTGPALGATTAQALALASSCNNPHTTVAYPGGVSAINGTPTLYSSLTTAAMIAGAMQGNPPATPLTNKALAYTSLEVNLTTSAIEELQSGGVLVAYLPPTVKVPTLATDVTTWLNSNNPFYIYNQQVALGDALLSNLLTNLKSFIGQPVQNTAITGGLIRNRILRVLNSLTGTIVAPGNPPSIAVSYNSTLQAWTVQVGTVLLGQTRYILLNVTLSPQTVTSSTAS